MGKPVDFPEKNFTWTGRPADEDRPEVLDLPAYRDKAQTISCWQLTEEEIEEVRRTGLIWLHVVGAGHPPVAVVGHRPFAPAKDLDAGE